LALDLDLVLAWGLEGSLEEAKDGEDGEDLIATDLVLFWSLSVVVVLFEEDDVLFAFVVRSLCVFVVLFEEDEVLFAFVVWCLLIVVVLSEEDEDDDIRLAFLVLAFFEQDDDDEEREASDGAIFLFPAIDFLFPLLFSVGFTYSGLRLTITSPPLFSV
jgi:hypothetical protein